MFRPDLYRPAGPTLKAFHESGAFYRALAGPIGAGKTTAAGVAEPCFAAMCQGPGPDGVRRAKIGVLRDTYRNLYATTMKTWHAWIPPELGKFVGSDDRPAYHAFTLETPIGPCALEVEFRALGTNSVEATCRGWELSGAYVDEADLTPPEAVTFLGGRVKRYGDKATRFSRGVWFTFNKPDVDHHLYNWCEEGGLEGLAFFDQPGGILDGPPPYKVNPRAENLPNLDDDYYEVSARGQPEWYVTRMIRNRWGASVSGEVIYPEFRTELHLAPAELEPPPGTVLRLGLDGGGTPAAVIAGRDHYGRRVVYAEVVLWDPMDPKGQRLLTGVGPKRFAAAIKEALFPRFRGFQVELGFGDPAAFYGADREAGELSFMETVGHELGIPIMPADSNEVALRHESVRQLLTVLAHDGRPSLIINPSCRGLRRGFTSDYKWEIVDPKQPGKQLKAQKSRTSHVHDALQYYCLGDVGKTGVTAGRAFDRYQPKPEGSPASIIPGWNQPTITAQVAGSRYNMSFDLWRS
jgi:hypothetical protein